MKDANRRPYESDKPYTDPKSALGPQVFARALAVSLEEYFSEVLGILEPDRAGYFGHGLGGAGFEELARAL